MGKLTGELLTLIGKQVQEHGIVVWYDPEGVYGEVAANLDLSDTRVLRFESSFFELRSRLEPLLEFVEDDGSFQPDLETPPRVVVYVPRDRAATEQALVEAEAAGVVMEPGASPWQRNTRLKVLAERVFKRIAPDRAAGVAAEVEAGRRTLTELDWLADQSGDFGAVKLIFGTTAVADVLLAFVASDRHDEAIVEKESLAELCQLLGTELGVSIGAKQPVSQARHELCRCLLLAELAIRVEAAGHRLPSLDTVPRPETARQQEQLLAMCSQWRNRLDLRDSYTEIANRIQNEVQVLGLGLQGEMLAEVETFSCLESILLEAIEAGILAENYAAALQLAKRRRTSFWALCEPDVQLRWTLLELAASMLLAAERIQEELKTISRDPASLIAAYVDGLASSERDTMPWSRMDRHQRHLEHRYAMLELESGGSHDPLAAVIRHARSRYFEVADRCAEVLGKAFETSGFQAEGIAHQRDVFRSQVRTRASEHKTAYLLVDALRYEMAEELVEGLGDDFEVTLAPALGQLPSITEVGMAALMPGAEQGLELVDAGGGRVGVRIGDTVLKDRASRWKHFQQTADGKTALLKLNDLMKPTKQRRDEIEAAELLLVTSQEIDRRGEETSDEEEARLFMAEVLEKVRRGIRRLAALGVKEIVVAADHGHVFVEEVDESMKMDAPGGETVDLHPRVWVGRGGAAHERYLRVTAGRLGMAGDLELVFPGGLACLRSRGSGGGYFHGGISMQEVVVPVATIRVSKPPAQGVGTTSVTLTVAKPKITTRFFSVEAKYVVAGLFGEDSK
ncbi:MAG: PglZ domain-containing protein, partial [Planctomycetes bacterium]|nr:PglZ domain-containing protein [Planctomycetota bacterium]